METFSVRSEDVVHDRGALHNVTAPLGLRRRAPKAAAARLRYGEREDGRVGLQRVPSPATTSRAGPDVDCVRWVDGPPTSDDYGPGKDGRGPSDD